MTSVTIRGGTFDRCHIGDVYIAGPILDDGLEFERCVARMREMLHEQSSHYVPLDVEPVVVGVDRDLRVIDHSPIALLDAFASHRHLILLGAAGAGKTSSLRHLACTGDGDLRVVVELSRFRQRADSSDLYTLLMLIGEQMMLMAQTAATPSVRLLLQLLSTQPVTLLLDGLNEVESSIRTACLGAIDDLRAQIGCRIVLATRAHGFDPPPEWKVVRLCELTDAQVIDYVRRNAPPRVAAMLEKRLSADENMPLRVPLFLKYIVDLAVEDGDPRVATARSRVSIVSRYIRLLRKLEDAKLHAIPIDDLLLRDVLSRIARRMQTTGQSITRREACALMADLFGSSTNAANEIFERIAARGLLTLDDRHLRFWHHTIQEYFYAESCHEELFRGRKIDRRLAKRLFTGASDEDALTFLTADATDREVEAMMAVAVEINPILASRWADDLSLDERGADAVEIFLRTMARQLRNIRWFSRWNEKRKRTDWSMFLLVGLFIVFAGCAAALSGASMTNAELAMCTAFGLVAIYALCMLLLYPGCDSALPLAAAIQGIRHRGLRDRFAIAFDKVVRSPLSRKKLVAIAETALIPQHSGDPLQFVEQSRAPVLAIQILANSSNPRASDALEALTRAGRGNAYSIEALRALVKRSRRCRDDGARATRLAQRLFADETLPYPARRHAIRAVKRIAPTLFAETQWRRFAGAARRMLLFAAVTIVCVLIGHVWKTFGSALTSDRFLLHISLGIVCAVMVYIHAKSIDAKIIVGLESGETTVISPFQLALSAAFIGSFYLLYLPFYVWHVPLIKLNARGPCFEAARAIYAELSDGTISSHQ